MTINYDNVYINDKYSLLSSTKMNPIVKENVNKCIDDYYLGEKTIELCESKYQKITINELLKNNKCDLIISGDLQNQILSSTLASSNINIPVIGIYSACATFVEGIIIASLFVQNHKHVIVSTSSHNLVSEKQFRYPIEYGAIRKRVNTCTVSGSVSIALSNKKSNIKVISSTVGKVTSTNHKDTNDMGSAMAPSCALVIKQHLDENKILPNNYDLVLTGDLGIYGVEIMKEYFKKISGMTLCNVIDAGSIFYKDNKIYAGASGPTCLPLVLFDYIIPSKKYKKILVVATGSMHSTLSSNLSLPIPSIAHAISLEVTY